ncbi:MAG: CPBP family intramembrane metalloprotease [Lachnospiraceae bacterium]|nr:CPBP family intramembrane metalloprotease [Lachnospiraceae bacterium]MDE7272783.1 CPBP family intramembrane metalloprotease [Lachnospiraceae bacterium]
MKKLYEKSELTFALVCIVTYCILQSLANPLNERIGIAYSASAVLCLIQAVVIFRFVQGNRLLQRYGLCKTSIPSRQFLYYVPLLVLATRNLWYGAAVNFSMAGTVCYIICMLCVGFVEEVIFRGFLFKAIAKDNIRTAIILSSITFGLGHLLNFVNGSGMELAANLFQVVGAIAIGFLFVILFYRGGSLLPCIITHAAINTISAFANETGLTMERRMVSSLILIAIIVVYTAILTKTLPKK